MTDARVAALLDKQEIHETLMRYCRGIDRCDEELVRSAYHEDSFDDHGHFKGNGWEFASFVVASLAASPQRTQHFIGNEHVELDGDVARSEAYFLAHHLFEGEPPSLMTFCGRYADRFERRGGAWRIAHRVVVKDWAESRPIAETFVGIDDPFIAGRRDRSDATYWGGGE